MRKTLVVMAAGIGSRYGGGIKQIEPVGPNGEIIIDYSIHDAISAGFDKLVIILRKDIEDDFSSVIGNRLKIICSRLDVELHYVFQKHPLNDPESFPKGRKKPWGTADAVRSCNGLITEPFIVINADDYYGKNAFFKAAALLEKGGYGMIGYHLGNTLSENGAVTRGICKVIDGKLANIIETSNIIKTRDGAEADGQKLPLDTVVSMNFWCFPKEFVDKLDKGFQTFISEIQDPIKEEYLLPSVIGEMVNKGLTVFVSDTDDKWFGVTYQKDKEYVVEEFRKLYDKGLYATTLYSDLFPS